MHVIICVEQYLSGTIETLARTSYDKRYANVAKKKELKAM